LGEESGEFKLRKEFKDDFLARAGEEGARSRLMDDEDLRRAEDGLEAGEGRCGEEGGSGVLVASFMLRDKRVLFERSMID